MGCKSPASRQPTMTDEEALFKGVKYPVQDLWTRLVGQRRDLTANLYLTRPFVFVNLEGRTRWFGTDLRPQACRVWRLYKGEKREQNTRLGRDNQYHYLSRLRTCTKARTMRVKGMKVSRGFGELRGGRGGCPSPRHWQSRGNAYEFLSRN